jgi:type I restriction enzyme S subunit
MNFQKETLKNSPLKCKIPANWEVDTIENSVKSIYYGYSVSIPKSEDPNGIPIISTADITKDDRLLYNQTRKIIPPKQLTGKLILKNGDLLFNWRNSPNLVGKSAIYEEQQTTHIYASFLLKITSDEKISHNYFLKYLFRFFRERGIFAGLSSPAVNQVNCNRNQLKKLSLLLPPIDEQKKIAAVLSAVQEAKEKTETIISAAKILKKSMINHLFTYGPLQPGEIHKKELKMTPMAMIPGHWQIKKFKDISILITKGSSPQCQGFEYCDKGILFIRSQNIGNGKLDLGEIKFLAEDFNKKEKKSILKENDLLINIVGASIGRAAIANASLKGGNLNQAVCIVRLKDEYNSNYVMNYLFSNMGQRQLDCQKKDIVRANLSLTDIGNLSIPIPGVECQEKISGILAAIDEKIETEENQKNSLEQLFKSLLDNLMTGKIRVNHLEF